MSGSRRSKKNSLLKKNFTLYAPSFNQISSVLDQGHFVRPTRHVGFTSDKYQILCQGQGKDGLQLASHIGNFLQASVKHLVNTQSSLNKLHSQKDPSQLNTTQTTLNLHDEQKYMILNLIDSCFQDLSNQNYQGSCCFCLAYLIDKQLFVVKNSQIKVFLVTKNTVTDKFKYQLKNVEACSEKEQNKKDIQIDKNQQSKALFLKSNKNKQEKWFFSCNKKYQDIIRSKYFPSLQFYNQKINDSSNLASNSLQTYLLIGSAQCFFHFNQKSLLQYFSKKNKLSGFQQLQETNKIHDYNAQKKGQQKSSRMNTQQICKQIVKECRRQWKTIYQHDISLITSKIK